MADEVAEIVAHDRADRGGDEDPLDGELVGGGGVDGGGDEQAFAGEREAHGFEADDEADDAVAVLGDKVFEEVDHAACRKRA